MKFLPVAALALFAAAPVLAGPLTIDFASAPSFGSVADTYAGSDVRFGGDALGLANDADFSYYSNAPSAAGVMFVAGPDATMNVANGFINQISFWYSSSAALTGAVSVWGGLNGSGALLGSFDLLANAQAGCDDTAFCHFDNLSLGFAGLAYSITFANDSTIAYDDIAINAVPEPTTAVLMSLGLIGLAAARRRRK